MNERSTSAEPLHATLARARSLAHRAKRDAAGLYRIEGVRHFLQAFDAGISFDAVILSPILLKNVAAERATRRLAAAGVRKLRVTPEQFRSVSRAERASGIAAIVRQHWTPLPRPNESRPSCWIVLEQIRSPGNLGTILRTAEATGVAGLIFIGPDCDPFDPAVVRASMGGLPHVPLTRTTPDRLAEWSRTHTVRLVGLSPEADRLWTDLPSRSPVAILLGEERAGLSDRLRALCDITVRLPMTGRADSLNVGVAAGVMMYELVRRAAAK